MSAEELSYQLPRRAGGSNLTWHDGRGQKTAHTRTVKLLQQPGTEGIQVKTSTWTEQTQSGEVAVLNVNHVNLTLNWVGWSKRSTDKELLFCSLSNLL